MHTVGSYIHRVVIACRLLTVTHVTFVRTAVYTR